MDLPSVSDQVLALEVVDEHSRRATCSRGSRSYASDEDILGRIGGCIGWSCSHQWS